MGWGDYLMEAGAAQQPLPVDLVDPMAVPRDLKWRARPYRSNQRAQRGDSDWLAYRPLPAQIQFTAEEQAFAGQVEPGFVVIEPHLRRTASSNKQWGWHNYAALVAALPELRWTQLGTVACYAETRLPIPADAVLPVLPGATHLPTPSFRQACAVLARAAAYLGPEGGLHHAAAAVGIPAVVLYGGFISPQVTGYPSQINIFTGQGLGCGRQEACGCACMRRISVAGVITALRSVL